MGIEERASIHSSTMWRFIKEPSPYTYQTLVFYFVFSMQNTTFLHGILILLHFGWSSELRDRHPCLNPSIPSMPFYDFMSNSMIPGLGRWITSYDHWLLFQRTWFSFPAPTWRLTNISKSFQRIWCPFLTSLHEHCMTQMNLYVHT